MGEETRKFFLDGIHQQLLDINKDVSNFIAEFLITPHLMEHEIPYKIAVVTQSQLDNGDPIDFKEMKGAFAGTVKNEEGINQNYFVACKADKPMKDMQFKLTLQKVFCQAREDEAQSEAYERAQAHAQAQAQANAQELQGRALLESQDKAIQELNSLEQQNTKFYKYILVFFVLIVGGFLMYYFYKQRQVQLETKPKSDGKIHNFF